MLSGQVDAQPERMDGNDDPAQIDAFRELRLIVGRMRMKAPNLIGHDESLSDIPIGMSAHRQIRAFRRVLQVVARLLGCCGSVGGQVSRICWRITATARPAN